MNQKEIDKIFDKANKIDKSLLKDIKNLSSGTISSLSGVRTYQEVEELQNDFLLWTAKALVNGDRFRDWSAAWRAYKKDTKK